MAMQSTEGVLMATTHRKITEVDVPGNAVLGREHRNFHPPLE